MTQQLFAWLSAVTFVALPAFAQQAQHKRADPDNATNGELYITRLPNAPHSLEQLCAQSSLIVEGTVNSVLQARDMGHHLLETDATVDVITTLKGHPIAQVAISQAGGTKDWVHVEASWFRDSSSRRALSSVSQTRYSINGSRHWGNATLYSDGYLVGLVLLQ